MKYFIILGVLVLAAIAYKEDFKCITDVPLKENDCNICMCAGGQIGGCSAKACLSEEYKTLKNCEVGLSWMKDECNRCWCVRKWGTICEGNPCNKRLLSRGHDEMKVSK